MSDDDYGFYGKGLEGYIHYTESVKRSSMRPSGGGGRKNNGGGRHYWSIVIIIILVYYTLGGGPTAFIAILILAVVASIIAAIVFLIISKNKSTDKKDLLTSDENNTDNINIDIEQKKEDQKLYRLQNPTWENGRFLGSFIITITDFNENESEIKIKVGDKLNLLKEIADENTVSVYNNNIKIAFIPLEKNAIITSLINSNNILFARVCEVTQNNDDLKIEIEIFIQE